MTHQLGGAHALILKVHNISSIKKRLEPPNCTFCTILSQLIHQRIYTDASLYNAEELEVITESAHQILGALQALDPDNKIKKEEIELVLELIPPEDNSEYICGYYFVCHERQCLFWLEEFDASDICNEIKVVVSRSHLSEHKHGF